MKVKAKINSKRLKHINQLCIESLVETADALKSNLVQNQTMPKDSGQLQDRSTFINDSAKKQGKVSIVTDTPYARRLYFHPEYNFRKDRNPNAGGMWFQPYIDGEKKDFVNKSFVKLLKGKLK